jgi:4-hydroxyphenylpyruvate dioxygenase
MAKGSDAADGQNAAAAIGEKLVGYAAFKRQNPRSDKFVVHRFHHVEFWTGEATMTWKR